VWQQQCSRGDKRGNATGMLVESQRKSHDFEAGVTIAVIAPGKIGRWSSMGIGFKMFSGNVHV